MIDFARACVLVSCLHRSHALSQCPGSSLNDESLEDLERWGRSVRRLGVRYRLVVQKLPVSIALAHLIALHRSRLPNHFASLLLNYSFLVAWSLRIALVELLVLSYLAALHPSYLTTRY